MKRFVMVVVIFFVLFASVVSPGYTYPDEKPSVVGF